MENQGRAEQAIITEDIEITGTIKAAGGLRMDGRLNGDINCAGDVVVGKAASIKGNLSVNSVTVEGQISGNIVAKDRIGLKAAARITGDVKAKRMTVEDGVSFIGKAEVNPSGVKMSEGNPAPDSHEISTGTDSQEKGRGIFGKR